MDTYETTVVPQTRHNLLVIDVIWAEMVIDADKKHIVNDVYGDQLFDITSGEFVTIY